MLNIDVLRIDFNKSKKEWFNDLIDSCEKITEPVNNYSYWIKDGNVYLEQDLENNEFSCDDDISYFYKKTYDMDFYDTNDLVTRLLKKRFKSKCFELWWGNLYYYQPSEEQIKNKAKSHQLLS